MRSLVRQALLSGLPLLGGLASAGCSSNGSPAPRDGATEEGTFVDCSTESRAQPAVVGLGATSSDKSVAATLEMLAPATLTKGYNTWQVQLADGAAAPLQGATVKVTPYMPDHMHGTKTVNVTDLGNGAFQLSQMYLYMAGYWEVTLNVTTAAGNEAVMFPVCIPG